MFLRGLRDSGFDFFYFVVGDKMFSARRPTFRSGVAVAVRVIRVDWSTRILITVYKSGSTIGKNRNFLRLLNISSRRETIAYVRVGVCLPARLAVWAV